MGSHVAPSARLVEMMMMMMKSIRRLVSYCFHYEHDLISGSELSFLVWKVITHLVCRLDKLSVLKTSALLKSALLLENV